MAARTLLTEGMLHAKVGGLLWQDMMKGYDSRPGLRRLDRPVLILQGHQDPIGQKTAEQIHDVIRNSRLTYIAKCGHVPWLEQPEAFARAISEFLSGSPK